MHDVIRCKHTALITCINCITSEELIPNWATFNWRSCTTFQAKMWWVSFCPVPGTALKTGKAIGLSQATFALTLCSWGTFGAPNLSIRAPFFSSAAFFLTNSQNFWGCHGSTVTWHRGKVCGAVGLDLLEGELSTVPCPNSGVTAGDSSLDLLSLSSSGGYDLANCSCNSEGGGGANGQARVEGCRS